MNFIPLSRCINKEIKYYGLKAIGLIFGVFFMLIMWIKFGIIFGIPASALGYNLGENISKYWNKGIIQKWLYWNLPCIILFRKKYIPSSKIRSLL